jgi:hypothetical protein
MVVGVDSPPSLHVYAADVSVSFLDKLDHPHVDPEPASGLNVTHFLVPAEPYETLRGRLVHAIGVDGGMRNDNPATPRNSLSAGQPAYHGYIMAQNKKHNDVLCRSTPAPMALATGPLIVGIRGCQQQHRHLYLLP